MTDTDLIELFRKSAELVPGEPGQGSTDLMAVETWREFEQKALDRVPVLVDGLWPEAAFGFVAAPPKKGKTWLALSLAISVATGKPFLGQFTVPKPRPVLYVALEGHRAGLRARVGALARGLEVNPDTDELDNLHWLYKPAGINLADPGWANLLHISTTQVDAALVIVDVLRASARLKENDQESFSALRFNLQPITDAGRSLAMLHHFGKLTETQKERDPGERMSGSGAMFGALDVAIYITGSDDNARSLRLEFDARDIAAPERLSVRLTGEGTGENGGLTYRDYGIWRLSDEVDEDDLKAPSVEIADYVREQGGRIKATEVRAYFDISEHTLAARLTSLINHRIDYVAVRGKAAWLVARPDPEPSAEEPQQSYPHLRSTSAPNSSALRNFVGEPHNGAEQPDAPHTSAVDDFVPLETLDLQGKDDLRSSALPTGEPDAASELLELTISDGEPEPFDHSDEEAQ